MQLYIEIVDYDISNQDELIDRFAIDLIDISNFSSVEVYTGESLFAEIELSFERVCAENFYGPRCEVFCMENCDCEEANCNNGTCMQGIGSITCACEPGFTGTDCSTDINECAGVDCNNGVCMDGINTFTCVCDLDATGELCRIRVTDPPPQSSPGSSQLLITAIVTPVLAVCFCLLIVIVVVLTSLYLRRRKDNSLHHDSDGTQLAVLHTTTGNREGSNVTSHENSSTVCESVSSLAVCIVA